MYRIYWLDKDEWKLYAREENEEIAHDIWNEYCDQYPSCKVKITKETVIKEA